MAWWSRVTDVARGTGSLAGQRVKHLSLFPIRQSAYTGAHVGLYFECLVYYFVLYLLIESYVIFKKQKQLNW